MADDWDDDTDDRENRLPTHEMTDARRFFQAEERSVEIAKLSEIVRLVRLPKGIPEDDKLARMSRAVELYASLRPADGLEGMLATQMVGTHFAALECLTRAMLENQTFAAREMNLKQAQRLMELYQRQVAALDKRRGKGQQKVTVEHVHVESGAQAIVGNVETGQRGGEGAPQPERLDQQEPIPAEFDQESKAAGRGKARSGKSRKT